MEAQVLWYDDIKGYGFAATTDGKRLFVHKRSFLKNQDSSSVVQGTVLEFEVRKEEDAFTESLNAGALRDVVGRNHRNPQRALGSDARIQKKDPAAIKIRIVREEQRCGSN